MQRRMVNVSCRVSRAASLTRPTAAMWVLRHLRRCRAGRRSACLAAGVVRHLAKVPEMGRFSVPAMPAGSTHLGPRVSLKQRLSEPQVGWSSLSGYGTDDPRRRSQPTRTHRSSSSRSTGSASSNSPAAMSSSPRRAPPAAPIPPQSPCAGADPVADGIDEAQHQHEDDEGYKWAHRCVLSNSVGGLAPHRNTATPRSAARPIR
jgi:hypothetical protein